ncbi:uncharacterized protein AB675_530 [Cyphellophora attinorum]|uniref:DUF7707 domain-containing protein n=1 Tax=Cyphellophora attinorum TaxID=1664694 RepID=A0A0N1P2P0_9EURO|nr:uncharacterized protein AB675_530 [Phialophora attinorum]KPI45630.1 hypothetical protein AB675_530 [Phialophora attinorum]
MLVKVLVGLMATATVAIAQETVSTYSASSVDATTTASQAMPPIATAAFNPAPINDSVRFDWCKAQLDTCPQICGGAAAQNYCYETNLTYSCVCPNGTAPDVTSFAFTLPFYICQQTYIQCINNNPDDAQAQANCTANEQCGERNATAEALSQTAASQSATASQTSSSASESGSATAASSSASASASGSSGAAVANVHELSTGLFAVLLGVAFKLFV